METNAPQSRRVKSLLIVFRVLFSLATAATIVFIFSNSAEIAQVSGEKSAPVTGWINEMIELLGFGFRMTEHRVRKLAHFSEYAMLGFWMMLTLRVYTKRVLTHLSWPLFFGLLIPVLDEALQTFVSGRSGEVRDVLIDFVGVCAGTFCGLFLLLLVRMVYLLRTSKTEL